MPDKFLFSNFAVTTILDSIGPADVSIQINTDDITRFPALTAGTKFPLILADSDDIVEILYVTAMSLGGVLTVERGREGTVAQSWLAGTLAQHTFTAATVRQAAGLNPRGNWSNAAAYEPNDLVSHEGIGYVAVSSNLDSEPSSGNDDWMAIYSPEGTSAVALTWQERWDNAETYSIGQLVEYQNRVWQSKANGNVANIPALGSVHWEQIARAGGTTEVSGILTLLGTDNYTVALSEADGPTGLFNGLRFTARVQNTNTGPATLTITRGSTEFAATPLRLVSGQNTGNGDLVAGTLYEWTYDGGTNEFLATAAPGSDIPAGTVVDFAGAVAPTGWLLCYGQAVSRTTYARLFAVTSTAYGAGDGSTTFNIPDLRGRVVAGMDNMGGVAAGRLTGFTSIGAVLGSQFVTLSTAELPSHSHTVTDPGHSHSVSDTGHNHSITDPTHGHVTNNPAHSHAITDPTHNHGLTDPGHTHNYGDIQPNYSSIFAAGATQASQNSGDVSRVTIASTTGITMAAAATGISIQNATTNISVNSAATGVQVNVNTTGVAVVAGGTGITLGATGGGASHNNTQPTLGLNKIIKI